MASCFIKLRSETCAHSQRAVNGCAEIRSWVSWVLGPEILLLRVSSSTRVRFVSYVSSGRGQGPGHRIAGSQNEGTVSILQVPGDGGAVRTQHQELEVLGKRKLRGAEEQPG